MPSPNHSDPTDRQALRLLMDNLTDYAIFFLDPDGRIVSWNAGAERLLGYVEAEVVGRSGSLIFTPEDRRAGAPERELQVAAANSRAEDERWHLRKDGSRFWGVDILTCLKDEHGESHGFAKILRGQPR